MSIRGILLALAAIILVAVMMAGNGTRPTKSDKALMSDLRDLSGFVHCVAEANGGDLPVTLNPMAKCGSNVRLAHPDTGQPYGYRALTKTTYQVCAPFAKPDRVASQWYGRGNFDPATGCATIPFEN